MTEYEILKKHWLLGSKIPKIKEELSYMDNDMIAEQFKLMFMKELGL
jgi:hypothetical protein